MRRRKFIAGLGAAIACPPVVHGQQPARMRRVGVLANYAENDPEANADFAAMVKRLEDFGWVGGRNVQIDFRWTAASIDRLNVVAKELVDLHPDVIFVAGTPATVALQRETRQIPIVFVGASDPVGSGLVASLARPGGNITGFGWMEPSLGGKWLSLLAEIAPHLKRVAAMFNPDTAPYVPSYYLPSFEAAAAYLKIEPIVAPVRSEADIDMAIASLGREPGGGFVAMSDGFLQVHRARMIALAAQHHVPAVYFASRFAKEGGLLSYATDIRENFRRAASYVDRILRGEALTDLPVQLPVKFEMTLNLKNAKALRLTAPPAIFFIADEIIE